VPTDPTIDFPELARESQTIWEQNGHWWDSNMGEGNKWHSSLIAPATERLLAIRSGEQVLDLACGNGQFTRRLASLGAHVIACDFSASLLECARRRTLDHVDRIEYRLLDLTSERQLATLQAGLFDAAVCNMALMDIASITPLLCTAQRALRPGGRFVFSVPHPCFNTNGTTLLAERDDFTNDGELKFSVRVTRYRGLAPQKAIGIAGQPRPHFYFHRPLHVLLTACFAVGFTLDGLEEPAFDHPAGDCALRWRNCTEIPPILVARMRAKKAA
jgi:SAM-dependent methyltransferase